MKVLQSLLVLFLALIVQVLSTSAASNPSNPTPPTPAPATSNPTTSTSTTRKYAPGDVIQAKPAAWGDRNWIRHWGVVVGQNPHNQKYKIAQISAGLPGKYRHREPATKYHPNAKKPGSKINTGKPVEVAQKDLRHANANDGWHKLDSTKLGELTAKINKNCPSANLRRRGVGCPPRLKSKQNASPQGTSRQLQGKKAGPKPAPQGKLRQVQIQGKKAWTKPNQSVLKGKPRKFGKKA